MPRSVAPNSEDSKSLPAAVIAHSPSTSSMRLYRSATMPGTLGIAGVDPWPDADRIPFRE